MENISSETVKNGVNVDALLGARDMLSTAPEAAKFTWQTTSEWIDGTYTHTKINRFFGLGEDHDRGKTFGIDTDHPAIFASEDRGATPVEIVLSGLAGCLTAGIASVAQNRGIQLRSVKAIIKGSMDIQGILGIDSEVRNGFDGIEVAYKIDADASNEDIRAVVAQSQKRSAVFDLITNPTSVTVSVK